MDPSEQGKESKMPESIPTTLEELVAGAKESQPAALPTDLEVKEGEEKPELEPAETQENRKWYIVQTQTSFEERVRASIVSTVEQQNLGHKIFQVVVPQEEVVELKDNKRVVRMRKLYPGYVFVEMVLEDDSWYLIRQVNGVAKFIGNKTRPIPVSDKEMTRVLRQTGMKSEVVKVKFELGESVRVISGPFRGHTGTVSDINASKGTLRALINIFGRDTPVELEFNQAEKL